MPDVQYQKSDVVRLLRKPSKCQMRYRLVGPISAGSLRDPTALARQCYAEIPNPF